VSRGFYQVDLTLQVTGGTGVLRRDGQHQDSRRRQQHLGSGSEFVHEYRGDVCTP
jgi:hypothetical protein